MSEETLCMKTRLERVALCADISSHYVQDMRVMPASGVARVAWDAMDHIDALGAEVKSWKMASTEAELECKALRARVAVAETNLAKAVEALTRIEAAVTNETDPGTGLWIECSMSEDEMREIAHAALAELTGGKDE